jgi:hypothetical protein
MLQCRCEVSVLQVIHADVRLTRLRRTGPYAVGCPLLSTGALQRSPITFNPLIDSMPPQRYDQAEEKPGGGEDA